MSCVALLKIDLYAPDDVLKNAGLSYHAMERPVNMRITPYPGLNIRIKPTVDDENRSRYSELFQVVTHKSGIFEVERCYVDVDSDCTHDITVILKGKSEPNLIGFVALKQYLQFFGFNVR